MAKKVWIGVAAVVVVAAVAVAALLGTGGFALFGGTIQRQTVVTKAPQVGVHTRVTDEVEPEKIEKTYQMVREMGAPWAVEYFPWLYMEKSKGNIDWSHADTVVNAAYKQGVGIIARIDNVPDWARPEKSPTRYLDQDNYEDYADFVTKFVEHYKGKIHYVIVWNEPNLTFEWGYRPPNPEAYTALLKMTYTRIKQVDPTVQVIAAGLAPTVEQNDNALSELVYLKRMYDAGAKSYFDIMSAHAYGWTYPFDDPADPSKINFARTTLLHDVMIKNGDGDKKVFITEGGWNDHPRWTKAVKPAQRIEDTVGAYKMVAEQWPWCPVVAMWAFRLPAPSHTYNDYYTFVNFDFTPKPIYDAVKAYATGQ